MVSPTAVTAQSRAIFQKRIEEYRFLSTRLIGARTNKVFTVPALTITVGAIPPTLPPSVEESYRRKCVQLKQRMNEVEDANDASRLRLVRMQRAIEKMRLERAFLLEQLAKRTSTNVEDSEGSPSPPPTPKEKPLRTKRGHRKPSFLANLGDGRAGTAFIQQGPVTLSPSSDAFSHTHPDANPLSQSQTLAAKRQLPLNGDAGANNAMSTPPPKRPRSAFDLYCGDLRSVLTVKNRKAIAEGNFDIERTLAIGWRELDAVAQREFQRRYEQMKRTWDAEKEKEPGATGGGSRQSAVDGVSGQAEADEDVEMGDDADEAASPGDGGGFTAVNRG